MATIGMNAAYRYWERVGWYPTHYCCLDEELIATHHDAIYSLVSKGLVRTAFVTGKILEFHPELADDDRFLFLESFHKGWHDKRGQILGLPFIDHLAFRTSAPSKVTTGAYAVRYAIFLGHRRLYLLGIDCNYVEIIEGAQPIGGFSLEMTKTPETNPNYFFDDYQRAGDRFHIPNPDVHGGSLHVQSLTAVRDDLIEGRLPIDIRNCSVHSRLTSEGIFPYEDLDSALQEPRLGAVAVPLTFREESDLIANLRRWDEPAQVPRYPHGDGYLVPLVLVLNGDPDPSFESRVTNVFDSCRSLRSAFSRLEFQYCRLAAEEDRYEMDDSKPAGPGGHRAGPNAQFFRGMKLLRGYGRYVFMMETDCLPMRPNWLGELERLVDASEPFWVLGSLYRGSGSVGDQWRNHINGNAVYAVGDDEFQRFLDEVWQPALADLVREMPWLAYDCVLPVYFAPSALSSDPVRWKVYQEVAHRFRYTEFIQNHYGKVEKERGQGYAVDAIRTRSPRTYIVHGRHLLSQADQDQPVSRRRANSRSAPAPLPWAPENGLKKRTQGSPIVAVIDPDALTWFGHFMAYNDKLASALGERGYSVSVICNKKLDPEILRERPHFRPRLSPHSWDIGKRFATEPEIAACAAELTGALEELMAHGPVIAYMYTGSVDHASMLARLAAKEPTFHADVNLFWAAFYEDRWDEWLARYAEPLRELANLPRMRVTVPTIGLQQAIKDGVGEIFEVAPHPSTAVTDAEFTHNGSDERDRDGDISPARKTPSEFRVLFPGNPRDGKGFLSTVAAAERLAAQDGLLVAIRYSPQGSDRLEADVKRLEAKVEVVRGELDNESFLDLFRKSHVTVLPYEPSSFAHRTSGLLIDSIYHGLPVVAIRGTWLGDVVERYGCGVALDNSSSDHVCRAVHEIVSDYSRFSAKARAAARSYFAENSWDDLARSIVEDYEREVQAAIPPLATEASKSVLLGPFARHVRAHIDESRVVAALLQDRQGPDCTMIDVGAHHGSAVAPFADMRWTVVACEPDSLNRGHLAQRFGERPNVAIDPRAVSDEPSDGAAFFASDESTGISGLHPFRDSHHQTEVVAVTTLAELADAYGLSNVTFLKVDVEGFEMNVLKGVPWERMHPEIIECEFEDSKTERLGYTSRDLADYLIERGYTVYVSEWHPVVRYGIRHDWRQLVRYPATLASSDAWGNILAFSQDPGEDALRAAFEANLEVATAEPATESAEDPRPPGSAGRTDDGPASGGVTRQESSVGSDVATPVPAHSPTRTVTPAALGEPAPEIVLPLDASLYDRFYVWARTRSPVVFLLGQMAMWCARKVRRYPAWTLAYVTLLSGLIGLGFFDAVAPYGPYSWVAAGLLGIGGVAIAVTGFVIFLLKHVRHDAEQRHLALRRRMEQTEAKWNKLRTEGREAEEGLRARIDALEPRLVAHDRLGSHVNTLRDEIARTALTLQERLESAEAAVRSIEEEHESKFRDLEAEQKLTETTLGGRIDALEPRLVAHDRLGSHVNALRDEIARTALTLQERLERAEGALRSVEDHEAKLRELQAERERLASPIEDLQSGQTALTAAISELQSERTVLLDIVSTLRKLRPLWEGTRSAELHVDEREHGHALLVALLVQEALAHPGILTGRTLLEVGTTRERDPGQSSTEKFAVFSSVMDMRFLSIDMDRMNTERASEIVRNLNPDAKLITAKGEDYLLATTAPVDYVYLDAFDFEHGQHSPERRARYREVLQTDLTDEASWKMHLVCAAALVKVLSDDGIIVIDDTWTEDDGELDGKGKLAVPLLLSSGFEIVARTPRAVALRRRPASIQSHEA